jgi:hypothetical protein
VPEPVIDVAEPVCRDIVELCYDRSIPPWQPTPARLIPPLNPVTVAADLVNAIGEGIHNAAALIGAPASLRSPAPLTADRDVAVEQVVSAPGTILNRVSRDVGDSVSQALAAVRSHLPAPPACNEGDFGASQRRVARDLAATRHRITQIHGAVRSVIGNGRNAVASAGNNGGRGTTLSSPARKTPVRMRSTRPATTSRRS